MYSVLRASYSEQGISAFLREIIGQQGRPQSLRGDGLPTVESIEPWDGKDGEVSVGVVIRNVWGGGGFVICDLCIDDSSLVQ